MIPDEGDVPLGALALLEQAIREHHKSDRLWVQRGGLIQLGPEETPYELNDALLSYQKAIEINPYNAETDQEIGHYFDATIGDESEARKRFAKAKKTQKAKMTGY